MTGGIEKLSAEAETTNSGIDHQITGKAYETHDWPRLTSFNH